MNNASEYNCSMPESLNNLTSLNCHSINETNETQLTFPLGLRTFQAVAYTTALVVGVCLSVFLISLILCCKSLRQRGFAVAFEILLVNIAFTIPVLTTSIQSALEDDWVPGDHLCQFIAFCNQSFQPQRWLLTAVLVIDRALTVSQPFKYETHRVKVVAILSIIALGLGLLIGIIPPSVLPTCNGFISSLHTCHFASRTQVQQSCGLYGFIYVTIVVLLGGVLPFCLYIWMFWKASRANRQVLPTEQTQINRVSSSFNSVSRKQLATIFLLFWTLLGCLLPYYIAYVVVFIADLVNSVQALTIGGYTLLITQPLYYGLIIADPIALMWHNDVKKELRKLKNRVKTTFNIQYLMSKSTPTSVPTPRASSTS